MARRSTQQPPPLEQREFRSIDEINKAVSKLKRRLAELEGLDLEACVVQHTKSDDVFMGELRDTILQIFGPNSPEYDEIKSQWFYYGSYVDMPAHARIREREEARKGHVTKISALIKRLEERGEDLEGGLTPSPATYIDKLNLHPRIASVSRDRFLRGFHWDAVFAASKALVNYVKEESGSDEDGAKLMYTVFSKKNPLLAFNDLSDQTDENEQEGMMHLFVGAVLAIRNPGGHSFPEGSEQRAIEYISLLSTLAYRVQEAKRRS